MRLDQYLVAHFGKTRSQAQDLIKRQKVTVGDQIITKTGFMLKDEKVAILEDLAYVSRGGLKLEDAIHHFHLDLKGMVMADIGASTGGFTDCALKHGVSYVYTYDVGTNQLHESLRNHPQVSVHEQTNILEVSLPSEVNLITVDVSFTSIKPILYHLKDQKALWVILFKPQFEVGKVFLKNGILKDKKKQIELLNGMIEYITSIGLKVIQYKASDLEGKMGNQEYLLYLKG